MDKKWIEDVLADLREFSDKNGLHELAHELAQLSVKYSKQLSSSERPNKSK